MNKCCTSVIRISKSSSANRGIQLEGWLKWFGAKIVYISYCRPVKVIWCIIVFCSFFTDFISCWRLVKVMVNYSSFSVLCSSLLVCVQESRRGRWGGVGREFSLLTAWWMELSLSLLVLALRLRNLLPDGSKLKKLFSGWLGSPAQQRAFCVRRELYKSWRQGREMPIIFSAVLTIRWRVKRQDAVQAPYHAVKQLVRMLSMAPL